MKKYVPQNNNFVVFDAYWNVASAAPGGGLQSSAASAYDRFS